MTTLPRSFRWFFGAEAISGFGSYITVVAVQSIVVLTLGGGATETGLVSAARWLPYLVLGLLVGALVDRMRRKPVMVWTDVARALLLLAIPTLWLLNGLTFPALLAILVAFGVASVVNDAASMAFLPRLVPAAQLPLAHSRIGTADAMSQILGPGAGGLLVRFLGAPVAVVVDAVSYLVAAVVVWKLKVQDSLPERAAQPNLRREIGEGVRWVYGAGHLAPLAAATHVWFAANAMLSAVFAPLVLVVLGFGPDVLGIALGCAGAGALVGAAVTTKLGARVGGGRVIVRAHVLSALAVVTMLAVFLPIGPAAIVAVLAGQTLHGIAMGASNPHEMAFRQARTPDALQGRVNITMRSANRAVIVFVAPLGGLFADIAGIAPALIATAVLFGVAALVLACSRFRT